MTLEHLALDRATARSFDVNGYLRVKNSNISKANICPYYGYEIPGHKELGLNPDQQYLLYRHPDELKRAVDTFKNIPLLNKHIPFDVQEPPKEAVVGSVGSNVEFNGIYVTADLIVTDALAIAEIQDETREELSPGYRYRPDMTPGEVNGQRYDGVMRDIVGNHLALVEVGRTGSDVVVGDSKPEEIPMTKAEKLMASLKPFLAQDADPEAVRRTLIALDEKEDEQAEDEDDEDGDDSQAQDSDNQEDDQANDSDEDDQAKDEDADDKPAMDAAAIERKVVRRFQAMRQAEADVKPLVGEVGAMDSAESIYHMALDAAGVKGHKNVKDVNALKAMVGMAIQGKQRSAAPMATDSAPRGDLSQLFPSLKGRK